MCSMKRIIASLVVFASMCVLGLVPGSPLKAEDDRPSIVGTWTLDATLAPGFTERELTAFNPGGTFTLTSSVFNAHSSENPFLPPFLMVDLSDGYGAWKRQEHSNRFSVTFKRLLFASANTPPDLYGYVFVGQHVGEATIQAVVTVHHGEDGDTLEGPFTFQLRNLPGEVTGTSSGTVSAKRLEIEPL